MTGGTDEHDGSRNVKRVSHKYHAKPTLRDGYRFASRREARRYDELKLLQHSGQVLFFLRQVPFHLPGGVVLRLDFQVFWADGHVSFEDPKGVRTQTYIAKKKICEALYPIVITEL